VVKRLPRLSSAVACASHLILAPRATTGNGGDQPFFMVCCGFTESPRCVGWPPGYRQTVGAKLRSAGSGRGPRAPVAHRWHTWGAKHCLKRVRKCRPSVLCHHTQKRHLLLSGAVLEQFCTCGVRSVSLPFLGFESPRLHYCAFLYFLIYKDLRHIYTAAGNSREHYGSILWPLYFPERTAGGRRGT
jgi:hypothetical protein